MLTHLSIASAASLETFSPIFGSWGLERSGREILCVRSARPHAALPGRHPPHPVSIVRKGEGTGPISLGFSSRRPCRSPPPHRKARLPPPRRRTCRCRGDFAPPVAGRASARFFEVWICARERDPGSIGGSSLVSAFLRSRLRGGSEAGRPARNLPQGSSSGQSSGN